MMEVAKYQAFMKSLLDSYSLPENLMEDIKELVYEEELTHYDNNNEFFAQMPLSPISSSSILSSVHMYQVTKPISNQQKGRSEKQANKRGQQPMVPKLDFSKLQFGDPSLQMYQDEDTNE
jgi:hypothetical protein